MGFRARVGVGASMYVCSVFCRCHAVWFAFVVRSVACSHSFFHSTVVRNVARVVLLLLLLLLLLIDVLLHLLRLLLVLLVLLLVLVVLLQPQQAEALSVCQMVGVEFDNGRGVVNSIFHVNPKGACHTWSYLIYIPHQHALKIPSHGRSINVVAPAFHE